MTSLYVKLNIIMFIYSLVRSSSKSFFTLEPGLLVAEPWRVVSCLFISEHPSGIRLIQRVFLFISMAALESSAFKRKTGLFFVFMLSTNLVLVAMGVAMGIKYLETFFGIVVLFMLSKTNLKVNFIMMSVSVQFLFLFILVKEGVEVHHSSKEFFALFLSLVFANLFDYVLFAIPKQITTEDVEVIHPPRVLEAAIELFYGPGEDVNFTGIFHD